MTTCAPSVRAFAAFSAPLGVLREPAVRPLPDQPVRLAEVLLAGPAEPALRAPPARVEDAPGPNADLHPASDLVHDPEDVGPADGGPGALPGLRTGPDLEVVQGGSNQLEPAIP